MKLFLLLTAFFVTLVTTPVKAQVNTLPSGRYECLLKSNQNWEKGDLVLVNETRYKLSSTGEEGEYRFSASAQRVFFMSGPLKGAVAKTASSKNKPVIHIPYNENEQVGVKLAPDDISCYFKG